MGCKNEIKKNYITNESNDTTSINNKFNNDNNIKY